MIVLIIWGIRIALIVAIIRILLPLFIKKNNNQQQTKEGNKRFEDKDKKVVDADFKEL
jgi:hypothetical protein